MASVARLDSIRADMLDGHFTFEEATALLSQDKDTRNNRGVMMNSNNGTTLFEMGELPRSRARLWPRCSRATYLPPSS